MSAETLRRAFASTATVLGNVSPEQFANPTPCASWDVRALVNHIVGGPDVFAEAAETGVSPGRSGEDFTTGDYRAVFRRGAERAVAAFAAEGAMEKPMKVPIGEVPGAMFVHIAAIDTFTHGWDLAKATGQATDLDPELASHLLAVARASLPDRLRGADGAAPFGPEVEAGESSTAADNLAAFMGRHA
ncbi:MAG: TIGR03086 family metal-binding protein [Acidimicrobiales bacterium]